MSSFYLLAAATVSHWFEERRALAIALVLVGFNLGYISAGPRWPPGSSPTSAGAPPMRCWARAVACFTLLAALTVRLRGAAGRGPAAARQRQGRAAREGVTLREALADPRQWYLSASWFLTGGLALDDLRAHRAVKRDQGIGLAAASLALTAYGLGSATGRVGSGVISEHLGVPVTIRIGYVLQTAALGVGVWWGRRRRTRCWRRWCSSAPASPPPTRCSPRSFPTSSACARFGAIMGVLALGWRTGAALGPAAAGFIYDATGSYAMPFGAAAPVAVLVGAEDLALGTARRKPKGNRVPLQRSRAWIAARTRDPAGGTRGSRSTRWPTACRRRWPRRPTR